MDENTKQFLLAVRRLERKHGLYLSTSEWMNLDPHPPKYDDMGVLAVLGGDVADQQEILECEAQERIESYPVPSPRR